MLFCEIRTRHKKWRQKLWSLVENKQMSVGDIKSLGDVDLCHQLAPALENDQKKPEI
jgi:hypothetical protein